MPNFLISIVRPKGYQHSDAFHEVAETLQFGLRGAGHVAAIVENLVDPQRTNILLGAHLLNEVSVNSIPPGSIIYNLEQLGSSHLKPFYYELSERYQIWDYNRTNLEQWRSRTCRYSPKLVEIGYTSQLRRIVSCPNPDIDVLFYGSVNEHRLAVLRKLQNAGVKVHAAFGVYGKERDALIARSKLVLNMHFYQANLFEVVRISYLLSNGKAVVSEEAHDVGEFRDAVAVYPYAGLVDGCLDLLRNEDKRRQLEARGFTFFSEKSEAGILSAAVAELQIAGGGHPGSEVEELRRLYLDMVQKTLINVIYEDPNQSQWAPREYDGRLRELGRDWPLIAHSMIGNARMTNLRQIVEFVVRENIPGDLIETGVWRGGACIMMRAVLKAYGVRDRTVWAADSFCGLPKPNPKVAADAGDMHHSFRELAVSLAQVQANFQKYGLLDERVRFLKGWFSETLPNAPIKSLAVLRLDGDMYESTMDALEALYDRVVDGGFIIVDDFGAVQGCQRAILDFRACRGIETQIQPVDGYGVFWRKAANECHRRPQSETGAHEPATMA